MPQAHHNHMMDDYEVRSFHHDVTPDQASMMMSDGDDDRIPGSQYSSRKRKRGMDQPPQMSQAEQQHLLWTDELLDYFMLQNSNDPLPQPPEPPATIDLNRAVDDKGHTPMHWAAAMGDLHVVNDLVRRGARIDAQAHNGETPLMRAVMFTNNWDKQTMERLINILHNTIAIKDWFGSTVFHHITATTCSKSKYQCARYYLDTVLGKLGEICSIEDIARLLDEQDHNGDTAIILAARFGARKCVRSLLNHGAATDMPNSRGETADELIKELNARRRDRYRQGSSSPAPQTNGSPTLVRSSPTIQPTNPTPSRQRHRDMLYRSEAATMLASQLPTLITSRAEALAAALEAELAERELETQEAERLLEQRKQEMEVLRRKSQALRARLGDVDPDDTTFDETQRQELETLIHESERLLELEQATDLRNAVQDEESKMSSTSGVGNDNDVNEKLQLAQALQAQQVERRKLVSEVVTAQSLASNTKAEGSKYDMYKRLIGSALGVPSHEVEEVLPEILKSLEENGAGSAGASDEMVEGHAEVMNVDGAMGMGVGGTPRLGGGHGFGPIGGMVMGGGNSLGNGSGRSLHDEMSGEAVGVMG